MRAIFTAGLFCLLPAWLPAVEPMVMGAPDGDPGMAPLGVRVDPAVAEVSEPVTIEVPTDPGAELVAEAEAIETREVPRIAEAEVVLNEEVVYEPFDSEKVVLPENIFKELREIIYQMSDRAPAAQMARERLVEAQGLGLVDRSARLPKLGGYAQYNYQTEQRESGATKDGPEFFWSINANQPVYQWGALEARDEIGQLRMQSVRTQNEGAYSDLLKQVRDLYLRIFQRKVSLELAREWLRIAEQDYAKAQRQEKAGELTDLSLIEAEVRVQENRADILNQEQDLAYLELRLRAISGWTGPIIANYNYALRTFLDTPVVDEKPPPSGNPTEGWTYQNIQTQIEIEKRNYTIAKAEVLPRFSVVGGIFQDRIDSAFLATSEDRINYFVGGLVSWSLFDGNASSGRKMAALARQRQLERQAELEVDLYRAEYARIASTLNVTRRGVEINQRLFELSEAKLSAATRRYESGAISSSELLYAKSGLNQSQLSLIESKISYLNALGAYLTLTGQDPALEMMDSKLKPEELPAVLNPWDSYN